MLCKSTHNPGIYISFVIELKFNFVASFLFFLSGVRPFGVSLLIAGWDVDDNCPYLYQCDPSVS
jgi:20S proteasome alpha/beta subunit